MPDVNLAKVEARSKLKPRTPPYWQRLGPGLYIGFRRMTSDSPGTWWARYRDPESRKQRFKSLDGFETEPEHRRFDAAKAQAEAWFTHLSEGGSTEIISVKRACELYVAHIRDTKGDAAADDMAGRYRRWVDESALGKLELTKASTCPRRSRGIPLRSIQASLRCRTYGRDERLVGAVRTLWTKIRLSAAHRGPA